MNSISNLLRTSAKIARPMFKNIVKVLAANSLLRKWLNTFYQRLTFNQMGIFQRSFTFIFEDNHQGFEPGDWIVNFNGKQIRLPLTLENLRTDWDQAVSILGHDVEVKQTYESLINSAEPPEIFIDIGANYGLHSLLFLVQEIETISFEPNTLCHDYFREVCTLNGVQPRIENIALGSCDSYVELCYAEKGTAHGSTNIKTKEKLKTQYNLITQRVKQKTLDDYLAEFRDCRLLLKIDTEGNECEVLRGAVRTLNNNRPLVIFESWIDDNRLELFNLLISQKYGVAHLPFTQNQPTQLLGLSEFLKSTEHNFIAIPEK
jgi:FkbM family methyltransferase